MATTMQTSISPHGVQWATVLAEKSTELYQVSAGKALCIADHESMQAILSKARIEYTSRRAQVVLSRLMPFFEKLKGLARAVTVFTQSDPTYSSLVWGSILVCLECIIRVGNASTRIIDMLEHLDFAMPRFDQYMDLYYRHDPLQKLLRAIYAAYLDFCICTFRHFRRSPLLRIVTSLWSNLDSHLGNTVKDFDRHSKEFEKEARLAHDVVQSQHRQRMEAVLTHAQVFKSTPFRCFKLPRLRNKDFNGRKHVMDRLQAALNGCDKSQRSCAIQGIGGMGKTSLAQEYCYRFEKSYRYIFWLRAEQSTLMSQDFCSIARYLSLSDDLNSETNHEQIVDSVHRWLTSNQDWLIVYDNAEQMPDLVPYWPRCNHGAIILTTQDTELARQAQTEISLGPFESTEGADLLLRLLPPEQYPPSESSISRNAERLSDEVGDSPLLLVELAGYIDQSRLSLAEVIQDLEISRPNSLQILRGNATRAAGSGYEKTALTVHAVSLGKLTAVARRVINIMSMLYSESVPEAILRRDIDLPLLGFLGFDDKQRFVREVRQQLRARRLVEINGDLEEPTLSMHRSLALSVLYDLDTDLDTRQKTFDQAVAILRANLPRPSPIMVPIPNQKKLMEPYLPHVLSLLKVYNRSSPHIAGTTEFAELLCNIGSYLYDNNFAKTGLDVLAVANTICEEILESRSSRLTNSLPRETLQLADVSTMPKSMSLITLRANVLAYAAAILWVTGEISAREQAHEWTVEVVKLREQYISAVPNQELEIAHRLLLANAYSDLSLQLINEEKYNAAEPYCRRSLTLKESLRKQNSIPPFEFAVCHAYMGVIRLAQGDTQDAVKLCEHAVSEANEDNDDLASLLYFKFILAFVLKNAGHDQKSLELHAQVLSSRIEIYGATGYFTLHSYFAVAQCQRAVGKLTEARSNLNKCIENSHIPNWSAEPLLRAKYELSLVLNGMGECEEAARLASEAKHGRHLILAKHSDIPVTQLLNANSSEMSLFDHTVNIEAGRSTIGELSRHISSHISDCSSRQMH